MSLALATKGRGVNSAVAIATQGKIWRRIAVVTEAVESAYSFVREYVQRSFVRGTVS